MNLNSTIPHYHGLPFARYAKCLAIGRGDIVRAAAIAPALFPGTPAIEDVLKSAVAAGSTTDAAWASSLAPYKQLQSDFLDYLRPRTILGKLQNLRRTPAHTKFLRQAAGISVGWVAEGEPMPLGKVSLDTLSFDGSTKIGGIVVTTVELAERSGPSSDMLLRNDLVKSVAAFSDVAFIDPSRAAVAGVSPASVTRGAHEIQSTGSTVAAIDTDLQAALAWLLAGGSSLETAAWVMHPATAAALGQKRESGSRAFPNVNARGGELLGIPVITSTAVASAGSPGQRQIVLIDAERILVSDVDTVILDVTQQASLQMTDSPSAGAQPLLPLWQNGLVALKVLRYLDFLRGDQYAVALITDVPF